MTPVMKQLRIAFALTFLFLVAAFAHSAVVINEVSYDDLNPDDREFVELYNNGPLSEIIGGWTLGGQDQAGANATVSITAGAVINPNSFYVIGQTGVANVNQIVPGSGPFGYFENDSETIELRNGGVLVDALLTEADKGSIATLSAGYGTLPSDVGPNVGRGFWGNGQAVDLPGAPSASATSRILKWARSKFQPVYYAPHICRSSRTCDMLSPVRWLLVFA
jgi:Lamin Tail Domain